MKCDNCKKESQWLEIIGPQFICHKCIRKNKIMGLVLRTHMDTFRELIKKLKIENYQRLMEVTRQEVEKAVNLRKVGIFLKTTNVVELD